ncbi:MAG: hypothetical protein J6Y10_07155 [Lachnospiraceae bacterium]|nr:hypothetical protein [Lachnospiraceae bacterium]
MEQGVAESCHNTRCDPRALYAEGKGNQKASDGGNNRVFIPSVGDSAERQLQCKCDDVINDNPGGRLHRRQSRLDGGSAE